MKFYDLADDDSRGERIKDKYGSGRIKTSDVVKTYFLKKHTRKIKNGKKISPIKREIKDLWS